MTFKNGFICSFDKVHEIINYMVPVGVVFNEHKEPRKKINSKYFFSDNCNLLPPVFGITFSLFRKNKDTLTDKQIYRFYNTHLTALHLIKNDFFSLSNWRIQISFISCQKSFQCFASLVLNSNKKNQFPIIFLEQKIKILSFFNFGAIKISLSFDIYLIQDFQSTSSAPAPFK